MTTSPGPLADVEAPPRPRHARRLEFVDSAALPVDGPPVQVVSRLLVDGMRLPDGPEGYFERITVEASREDGTVVTFHGVHAPSVEIEVVKTNGDGSENLRLRWAGHEWLTPRDAEQVKRLREAATSSDVDERAADFSVFAAEVVFRDAAPRPVQWFRNGDHPLDYVGDQHDPMGGQTYTAAFRREQDWEGDVVRRFRHPSHPGTDSDPRCGRTWHVHGWIDGARNNGYAQVVCPGDWIVPTEDGHRVVHQKH